MRSTNTQPIQRATKRTWNKWLKFMDKIGAKDLNHTEIANCVYQELDGKIESAGWWSQNVTVAYEQHIGRRTPGQRADGTFEISVSKATQLNMKELMAVWTDFATKDQTVLRLIAENPRVSGTEKRMNWRAKAVDGSSITITSEPKKDHTASIIATLSGITSNELNLEGKAIWLTILTRFMETLQKPINNDHVSASHKD